VQRKLSIAQIAPVAAAVRPGAGDSIEQLVGLLCEELVRRGHDVTLYATGDSITAARLRSVRERGWEEDAELWDWQFSESMNAAQAFAHAADHDVIHAHDLNFALPFAGLVDTPVVETQHVDSSPEVRAAQRRCPNLHLVAASEHQRALLGDGLDVTVVPHGIDVGAFPFGDRVGEHLLFLGRMLSDKGPLDAIRVAHAAGMPLVLAGPLVEGDELALDGVVDGERVRHVGAVDHATRNELLAGAAALLFPARYPEPFGLVMIEAMACGTPVLATALGAAPDIVEHGLTGFTAPTWEGLAALLPEALALDRGAIRERARERFDVRRMTDDYEALYHRITLDRDLVGVPA
jgi:glycosyltransferase involved in cell wall biosynthesis